MNAATAGPRSEAKVTAVALALVTLALWVPVGLGVRGTIEELLILEQQQVGISVLHVGGHFLRPLAYAPFYLGYLLTPGSFLGLNLLQMIFLWGKGMGFYLVLRQLGAAGPVAQAAALLLVLYPADDGQMTLRTVAIHGCVTLFMLSVHLLLRLGGRWHLGTAVGMAACLAVAISIYEAPVPLACVVPVSLLWLKGRQRRVAAAAGVWYGVLAVWAVRYLHAFFTRADSYQDRVLAGEGGASWLPEVPRYLAGTYARILAGGWLKALGDVLEGQRVDLLLAAAAGIVAAAAVSWSSRRQGADRPERRLLLTLALAGLVVVALGFVVYLPTNLRTNTWRTLLLPSIGGAIVVTSLLRWLTARRPAGSRAFATAVGALAALGFASLAAQHRSFAAVSERQLALIDGIEGTVPAVGPHAKLLLVFDETGSVITNDVFPSSRYLRAALYGHFRRLDLNVHVCYPFVVTRGETCVFAEDTVTVEHSDVGHVQRLLEWQVPYEAMVALRYDRAGRVTILDSLAPWLTLLPRAVPLDPSVLVDAGAGFVAPSGSVRLELGTDGRVGAGWSFARVTSAGLTYRFMTHSRGAVHAPLLETDYRVEVRIANAMSPELLASLGLSVAGEPIPLTAVGPGLFQGEIPARLVAREGETTLVFEQDAGVLAAVQAEKGPLVGLGFDWIRLEPNGVPPGDLPDEEIAR